MFRLEHSVVINRPIEQVFEYVTNIENAPKWKSRLLEIKRTSEGPVGVGTTQTSVGQFLMWRPQTNVEITEYAPNRKVGFKTTSGPVSAMGEFTFESVEGGTRVTLVSGMKPTGFLKLVGPILARWPQSHLETEFAKLKELLEAQ
jgi:uncharacterized membrane protein